MMKKDGVWFLMVLLTAAVGLPMQASTIDSNIDSRYPRPHDLNQLYQEVNLTDAEIASYMLQEEFISFDPNECCDLTKCPDDDPECCDPNHCYADIEAIGMTLMSFNTEDTGGQLNTMEINEPGKWQGSNGSINGNPYKPGSNSGNDRVISGGGNRDYSQDTRNWPITPTTPSKPEVEDPSEPENTHSVPEPATIAMIALGAAWLYRKRQSTEDGFLQ